MENKQILSIKRNINEITQQHNRLTALCALLYKNIRELKNDLHQIKQNSNLTNKTSSNVQSDNSANINNNINGSINDLKADDILRQLSQNQINN
tara:strand:- start:42 stop:323 length:282 start_codon:yes stop_codon:yes gene_type:complete